MKKIIFKIKLLFIPCEENNYRPEILQDNFLLFVLLFLFFSKFIIIPFLIYFPNANLFADISKAILIELTNKQRQELGLNALKENSQLNQAALLKAQDILTYDYFSHQSPQGKTPWYWIKKTNYDYQTAGENLGIGFLDSIEVHQAWENSPSHKANLINSKYKEIGMAVVKGDFKGNETVIVVQLFGNPRVLKQEKSINNQQLTINNEENSKTKKQKNNKTQEQKNQPEVDHPLGDNKTLKQENTENTENTKMQEQENQFKADQLLADTKVLGSEDILKKEESDFLFNLLKFMSLKYSNLTQKITFFSLFFIILAFLINVLVHIKIQHRDLIYKTIFCIFLLIAFTFIDKDFIFQIIPHNLQIK